jgi:hypothetical protein
LQQADFYKEGFILNDDKHIFVYKSDRSPNWYLRFYTGTKYINRTLRTADKTLAVARALELVVDLKEKIVFNQPLGKQTLKSLINWFLSSPYAANASEGRLYYIKMVVLRIHEFLGEKDVETISLEDWVGYWDWRLDYAKHRNRKYNHAKYDTSGQNRPTAQTLRAERQTYNQVIRAAIDGSRIVRSTKMPIFPARKYGDFYRPKKGVAKDTFTKAQYRIVREAISERVRETHARLEGKDSNPRLREIAYIAKALQAYVAIIRNCGARPYEVLELTAGRIISVKVKTDKGDREAMGFIIHSSKAEAFHKRVAIITYAGEQAVRDWLNYRSRIGLKDKENSYIFSSWKDHKKTFGKGLLIANFRKILKKIDMKKFDDGFHANFKALRRLFIVTRLDAGVPIQLVAQNCGNSVATIRRYYDSIQVSRYASDIYASSYFPEDEEE